MATLQSFNVAVIGYGMSAKVFHIPLIQHVAGLNLYAILQRSPKPENDAGKDHPSAKSYRDLGTLVADPEVHVVVVTTTPETHFDIAKEALEAGKHVVVEKPFAPTSKECDELVSLAQKVGKILTVYQNRRWDLDFLTLRSLLDSNTLGRVVDVQTYFNRHRPQPKAATHWKSKPTPGNGAIYDLGSHLLDQLVVLFGLPQKVTAFLYSQAEGVAKGAEDSCTVILHYASGLTATAKATVINPEEKQLRFWVKGVRGSFKKYGLDTQEDALNKGSIPSDAGFGQEPESQYGVLSLTEQTDGLGKITSQVQPPVQPQTYVAFYTKLLAALRGEGEVPVDVGQAAKVMKLIELAIRSSEEGRTLEFA